MTFYGYIRISDPKQGRGVSLQEQRAAIERFAERNRYTIGRWFEERETAAKRGRRQWTEMLKLLRLGKAQGVLIHKIDRSARNLRDWSDLGDLIDRGIAVHFVNESLDLKSPGGRLSADIQAVIAAHYIRNLREEALKGIYGRLKQGILPLPAPVGYLDCGAGKPKEIDPTRGPLVRRVFKLYASGRYSLHALRDETLKMGLRNRRGGAISINGLSTMLRNPFYVGLIRIKRRKEIYEGAHEPLIPRSVFERVQRVLDGKLSFRSEKHDFIFRRTLRCKGCGYALIGESRKGHTYYRCHTKNCPTRSVREEVIEGKLKPFLEALQFLPEERAYLPKKIEALEDTWQAETATQRKALELQLGQLATRRTRLTDAFVDGLLERDLFEERKEALFAEKQALEERLTALDEAGSAGPQKLADFLGRLDSAYSLYQAGTPEEKRDLVALFTSDWLVERKNVDFTPLPEAQLVADRAKSEYCGPERDRPRTWDHLLKRLIELLNLTRRR